MGTARKDGVRRREELLDAALRCFTDKGLLATGIEDIRKAAGASPSSVYHLFGGLPDLVAALLVRTFTRVCAQLTADVTTARTARDAVHALVRSHLNWVDAHPDEARFMYQAMALELASGHAERLAAAKRELQEPVSAHLATFVAAGELPGWEPGLLETVLLGPSHELSRRWLATGAGDLVWARAALPGLAWRAVRELEDSSN
ncbi:TetR/AcrR family transcriptional regulator [Phytohabitans sp. LJ34]|uniref:TetR/AcrR family transcriptional regulator n=1 Tax=Phytohabitans sp. LJ34 TaxID=3452217 RepID=UPI003F8C4738